MAHYKISTVVAAPIDKVFALWTDLERMGDWVGGVTGVTDISGPIDKAGTTYVVHFGLVKSPTAALRRSSAAGSCADDPRPPSNPKETGPG